MAELGAVGDKLLAPDCPGPRPRRHRRLTNSPRTAGTTCACCASRPASAKTSARHRRPHRLRAAGHRRPGRRRRPLRPPARGGRAPQPQLAARRELRRACTRTRSPGPSSTRAQRPDRLPRRHPAVHDRRHLLSTPHKVRLPHRERYAMAYFHEPAFQAVVRPLRDPPSEEYIHYGTHFTNMFSALTQRTRAHSWTMTRVPGFSVVAITPCQPVGSVGPGPREELPARRAGRGSRSRGSARGRSSCARRRRAARSSF